MAKPNAAQFDILNDLVVFNPIEGGAKTVGQVEEMRAALGEMVGSHNGAVLKFMMDRQMISLALMKASGPLSQEMMAFEEMSLMISGALNVLASIYERDINWVEGFLEQFGE